ncbi:hypothetical protein [Ramlibacter alkalitolerans]|uniref:Quinol:cytochrome C oxidoreductase n=1 Tax=Ramlibacter alkalitolerans TaxID=2039631 RepID=A0ABS1JIB9_9BURK|nr:hypothetical protein [Ramlibacter alkalitolerans]MBL0423973.1 hypothetical protein [Ramlibacter alkalitolerans]
MRSPRWLGVVLLAACLPAAWLDLRLFLACWLAVWWWCLGLVLGVHANAWIRALSGGAWGDPFVALAPAVRRRLPWLLLALLPLAAGAHRLYPWAAGRAWLDALPRPDFPRAWLSQPFFLARLVAYALLAAWITRGTALRRKGAAAGALAVYALAGTLAAIDLLMSLQQAWYSTAFGLVVLGAQSLSGAALVAVATPRSAPEVPWRDLGNLLLMWVMTWAYLAFMQFLVIWAENLPREVVWYVPRLAGGWGAAGLALVLLQLGLSFLALLFRAVKDEPRRLKAVAAMLLATTALDAAWTVVPSVAPRGVHALWLLPLMFAAAALLMLPGLAQGVRHGAT